MVDERSKALSEVLIHDFRLTISFRMEGSGQLDFDPYNATDFIPKCRSKCSSYSTDMKVGYNIINISRTRELRANVGSCHIAVYTSQGA